MTVQKIIDVPQPSFRNPTRDLPGCRSLGPDRAAD
jgi:hypothetical protein